MHITQAQATIENLCSNRKGKIEIKITANANTAIVYANVRINEENPLNLNITYLWLNSLRSSPFIALYLIMKYLLLNVGRR